MNYGYNDRRIDSNAFLVAFRANAYTPQEAVESYLLRRCAEVTVGADYDYFVIIQSKAIDRSVPVMMPGSSTSYSQGSANLYGNTAYGSATTTTSYTPGGVFNMRLPGSSAMIKTFHGKKPQDNPMAFDAREILEFSGK